MNTRNFNNFGDVFLDVYKLNHLSLGVKPFSVKYLLVALNHVNHWAYLELHQSMSVTVATGFLENLARKASFKIHTLTTSYDTLFFDHCADQGERIKEVNKTFSQFCTRLGIALRIPPLMRPCDVGGMERFLHRLLEDLKKEGCSSSENIKQALLEYVRRYNDSK